MQFLAALVAFLKAVPYFDKWGTAFIEWAEDELEKLRAKKLQKDIDAALNEAEKTKDTSALEKILRGD